MSIEYSPYRNNLTGPPRSVPLAVRLRLLLGGFLNQFGWLFFGFGMIFVWVFVVDQDLTGWYVFRGTLESAEGITTRCEETNATINERPVYAIHYEFNVDDDQYAGVSYSTGKRMADEKLVTVEFPAGNPLTHSRHADVGLRPGWSVRGDLSRHRAVLHAGRLDGRTQSDTSVAQW